jgi:hypothetical protein
MMAMTVAALRKSRDMLSLLAAECPRLVDRNLRATNSDARGNRALTRVEFLEPDCGSRDRLAFFTMEVRVPTLAERSRYVSPLILGLGFLYIDLMAQRVLCRVSKAYA